MDIVFGPQGDFDEVYLYVRVDALFAGFGILLTTLTSRKSLWKPTSTPL